MLWILLSALLPTAQADSFRFANGSVIEGTLATYELGGNCQIFVASGPVRGATLLLPCAEIQAFSRLGLADASSLAVEEVAAPAAIAMPLPVQDPVPAPGEPPPAAAPPPPVVDEPVSASLPAGMTLPGDDGITEAAPPTAHALNLRGTPRPVEPIEAAPEAQDPAPAPGAVDTPPSTDGSTPSGWRSKDSSAMPRWLHRTIYGDPPAPPPSDEQGT